MSYLQRLIDGASLGVSASAPLSAASLNAGDSPVIAADQRIATFPDALQLSGFTDPAAASLDEPAGARANINDPARSQAPNRPQAEQQSPIPVAPTPARFVPPPANDVVGDMVAAIEATTGPAEPAARAAAQLAEPQRSQPAQPVRQEATPAHHTPSPQPDQPSKADDSPADPAKPRPAAAAWPISAADFTPIDAAERATNPQPKSEPGSAESSRRESTPEPLEPNPLANDAGFASAAQPLETQAPSPLRHEPTQPAKPDATAPGETRVITEHVIERVLEQITERTPPTPSAPPQTAEQVSVIGPLRGLSSGRWRYVNGVG